MKIQLLLIGLVFVSLLAFGWGSGVFVRNQYNEYTNFIIREKLASVDIELRGKLGAFDSLSIHENGNYVAFLLHKFSKDSKTCALEEINKRGNPISSGIFFDFKVQNKIAAALSL